MLHLSLHHLTAFLNSKQTVRIKLNMDQLKLNCVHLRGPILSQTYRQTWKKIRGINKNTVSNGRNDDNTYTEANKNPLEENRQHITFAVCPSNWWSSVMSTLKLQHNFQILTKSSLPQVARTYSEKTASSEIAKQIFSDIRVNNEQEQVFDGTMTNLISDILVRNHSWQLRDRAHLSSRKYFHARLNRPTTAPPCNRSIPKQGTCCRA